MCILRHLRIIIILIDTTIHEVKTPGIVRIGVVPMRRRVATTRHGLRTADVRPLQNRVWKPSRLEQPMDALTLSILSVIAGAFMGALLLSLILIHAQLHKINRNLEMMAKSLYKI